MEPNMSVVYQTIFPYTTMSMNSFDQIYKNYIFFWCCHDPPRDETLPKPYNIYPDHTLGILKTQSRH